MPLAGIRTDPVEVFEQPPANKPLLDARSRLEGNHSIKNGAGGASLFGREKARPPPACYSAGAPLCRSR